MGESPGNSIERQPPGDLSIPDHIVVVIIINELMAKRLSEDQPCNCRKEKADAEDHPTSVQTVGAVSGFRRDESAALSRCCTLWGGCFS